GRRRRGIRICSNTGQKSRRRSSRQKSNNQEVSNVRPLDVRCKAPPSNSKPLRTKRAGSHRDPIHSLDKIDNQQRRFSVRATDDAKGSGYARRTPRYIASSRAKVSVGHIFPQTVCQGRGFLLQKG